MIDTKAGTLGGTNISLEVARRACTGPACLHGSGATFPRPPVEPSRGLSAVADRHERPQPATPAALRCDGTPAGLESALRSLLPRLRLAVVHGGDKEQPGSVLYRTANTRPWKSYREVAEDIAGTLSELGCRHVHLVPDDMRMAGFLRRKGIEFAWLNSGGVQGDNPVCHAAASLEMLGIPYVGHNPFTAALLDEKDAFKRHLQALGIPTAPFVTWQPATAGSLAARLDEAFGGYRGPFVVKPVSGRASLHVHRVESIADIAPLAGRIFAQLRKAVLIEKFLPGREFCVAVCGPLVRRRGRLERLAEPFAFAPLERKLEPGETIFTSMDKKAITAERAALVSPGEGRLREDLLALARRIYTELDLKTLVRVDIRADAEGRLHVLETNPKPDLKRPGPGSTSLVALGLPEQGLTYPDLIYGLLADRFHDLLASNPTRLEHLLAVAG
jgi:D-alanine-D-alanine ligase